MIVVVSRVLKDEHILEGHHVAVAAYYECLGPVPPGMGTTPCWIQPSVTVNFDPHIVQFVAGNEAIRSCIEATLSDLSPSCTITWPDSTTSDSGTIVISFAGVINNTSSMTTSKACTDQLSKLLGMIEAGSISVLQEVWPSFVEQWEEQFPRDDKSVRVQIDPSNCSVHVVGEREKYEEMKARLDGLQSDLVMKLRRSETRITERIPNILQHQLYLLETCGFFNTESADDFTASVTDNVIILEGQPDKVMDWKVKMYQKLAFAQSETASVDEYVLAVLEQQPFRRHLEQLLQPITGVVWYTAGKKIEVYGESQDKVNHLILVDKSLSQKILACQT